jgi:hypothetical protein
MDHVWKSMEYHKTLKMRYLIFGVDELPEKTKSHNHYKDKDETYIDEDGLEVISEPDTRILFKFDN